jgi:hypothetical protein
LRDETEFLGEIFNRVAFLWVHVGHIINPTWSESVNDGGISDARGIVSHAGILLQRSILLTSMPSGSGLRYTLAVRIGLRKSLVLLTSPCLVRYNFASSKEAVDVSP